jgi:protein tyrosine phosphatase (PTP) superfamily phosphohydrolase (DUF442 family)
MATSSIFNFIAINERIGTGGQPTKKQLAAAHAEGYQAVINLAPSDAQNNALPGEDKVVQDLGMEYHHIPVEWTKPEPGHFAAFTKAMDALKDKKVFIHCAANYRVTAFFSSYAMNKMGWSTEQANDLVSKIWESNPEYKMNATWQSFIDESRDSAR